MPKPCAAGWPRRSFPFSGIPAMPASKGSLASSCVCSPPPIIAAFLLCPTSFLRWLPQRTQRCRLCQLSSLDLLQTLSTLPAQLAALQQQLAALTQRLVQPPHQSPATAVPSQAGQAGKGTPTGTKGSTKSRHATVGVPKRPEPPAHVLPLVEYGAAGHYVVICPKGGLLPLEPDTPEWFAWLAAQSSFRFVGKLGRFSAHHEWRVPRGAWRAHRQIRNHSYTLRLAPTHDLTIAVLEQTAEALQAHLT